jgi:hypothetical protein
MIGQLGDISIPPADESVESPLCDLVWLGIQELRAGDNREIGSKYAELNIEVAAPNKQI